MCLVCGRLVFIRRSSAQNEYPISLIPRAHTVRLDALSALRSLETTLAIKRRSAKEQFKDLCILGMVAAHFDFPLPAGIASFRSSRYANHSGRFRDIGTRGYGAMSRSRERMTAYQGGSNGRTRLITEAFCESVTGLARRIPNKGSLRLR
jgi:hypothetical protein